VDPEEARKLREGLERLGWSPRMAAEKWGVNLRTVERWLSGDLPLTGPVRRLLEVEKPPEPLDLGD
jgi:hypothetical protein